ncbi:hypothetical protein M3Y94_00772300 [Aphelenchoides besseyi]|nr:hypothetical protein M3Y94_00772300 [Aphelenchoides besseyi]
MEICIDDYKEVHLTKTISRQIWFNRSRQFSSELSKMSVTVMDIVPISLDTFARFCCVFVVYVVVFGSAVLIGCKRDAAAKAKKKAAGKSKKREVKSRPQKKPVSSGSFFCSGTTQFASKTDRSTTKTAISNCSTDRQDRDSETVKRSES